MANTWGDGSITEGFRALGLFVNRADIGRNFLGYLNDPTPPNSVMYLFGESGNGKSLALDFLRTRLCKSLETDNWSHISSLSAEDCVAQVASAEGSTQIPFARLNFFQGPNSGFEALAKLRRDLSGSGARFPIFDYAIVSYLYRSHQLSSTRIESIFPANEIDLVHEIVELFANIPGTGAVVSVSGLLEKYLGNSLQRYRMRRKIDEEIIQQIHRMDHETELIRALPHIFGEDLNAYFGDPDQLRKVVLFFDAHEALWGSNQSMVGALYYQQDEWLRRLITTVNSNSGIVVVVAGQNPPKWSDASKFPIVNIDLQYVGELAEKDALEYLTRAGVDNSELRAQLMLDSRVSENEIHPFSLGLATDSLRAGSYEDASLYTNDGAAVPRSIASVRQLVDRFLTYMDAETRDAIIALSACRSFDREIYFYLGQSLNYPTSHTSFQYISGLSLVHSLGPEQFSIHELLRRRLSELGDSRLSRGHQALSQYYQDRMEVTPVELAHRDYLILYLIEFIYHEKCHDWRSGYEQWLQIFDISLLRSRMDISAALYDLRPTLSILGNRERGLADSISARYMIQISRFPESQVLCLNALESFQAELEDSPEEPAVLNDLGNALMLLGDLQPRLENASKARNFYLRAIEVLEQAADGSGRDSRYLRVPFITRPEWGDG